MPIEVIDAHRPRHLAYLDSYYDQGTFLLSGPQEPRDGGIIFAKASSKATLETILAQDPFAIHGLADYSVFAFVPNKCCALTQDLFDYYHHSL